MRATFSGNLLETERLRSSFLERIRLLALRRHVFFKVLNRVERALLYLASKVIVKVQSRTLVKALSSIVNKLLESIDVTFNCQIRRISVSLAEKLSGIAQKWGNVEAKNWAHDERFIRYLMVTTVNDVFSNRWSGH